MKNDMKFLPLLLWLLFAFSACSLLPEEAASDEILTLENSVEKDLSPYDLPLKVRFPLENKELGNFKSQVVHELDGFIWHLKKGDDFQFIIEELGDDSQIYDNKIAKMLSLDYFSKNVVLNTKDLFVTKFTTNEGLRYYIARRIQTQEISFMATTIESGVKANLYPKMLQTIKSIQ